MFGNKKISIAVVGIRASGKSYLLSDIITSFGNLGYNRRDSESGQYASFGNYKAKTRVDGKLSQTEMYACRPGENIYGAVYDGHGAKLDVDFVDIPGEVFNGERSVNGNTFLTVFTTYRNALERLTKKLFTVTVWKNEGGLTQLIVEPFLKTLTEERRKELETCRQGNKDFDKETFKTNRLNAFQGWSDIYSWLRADGYKECSSVMERISGNGKKTINGKTLLKNFFSYQPDSLMCSLAEVVDLISPGLGIKRGDFENGRNKEAFYFLYYCSKATDIVICDKLFVPGDNGGFNLDTDDNYRKYATITNELHSFIKTEKVNVYLAFRGVDYLLRAQKSHYVNLITFLKEEKSSTDKIRNTAYSIFAYLLWHHIDAGNVAKDDEAFRALIGYPQGNLEKDRAAGLFIDLALREENDNEIDLRQIIPQHVGTGSGEAFRQLLLASYGYNGADKNEPMQTMPPHTYFTCTPVTADFEVYVNDPKSGKLRFIHPGNALGPSKYFDTAGSNFCFGTYQLCLDILSQHDVDIDDWSVFGELINSSIRKQ